MTTSKKTQQKLIKTPTPIPIKKHTKFNFTMGADPEFILTMQDQKVDARQTMELMLANQPDFENTNDGYDIKKFGNIGWDGANSTGEIRPAPSNDPYELTKNIHALFKHTTQHIKICDILTISKFSAIGGHIHFEKPKDTKWTKKRENIIHKQIASFYLPLLISENKINLSLRLRQNYGSLKDKKVNMNFSYPNGDPGYTLEFRTPSAEWLTTPKLTTATFAYLGTIYHEIINHPQHFSKFKDLIYQTDKQGDALQTLAILEFDLLTNTILKKAQQYIKTFEMYPKYKKEIAYIFNPKQIIKDKQQINYNIMLGWNLTKTTNQPTKRDMLASKKTIQNIAEKTDFDILKKIIKIQYNDDTKVSLFVETLKDRIAAFNWKLKNEYYIFGIRKGIPTIITKNLNNQYLSGSSLIKTQLDLTKIEQLFDKMINKLNITHPTTNTIDFITGKLQNTKKNTIIIGIPYEMRIKEDFKPFLNLIWSLEKESIQPEKIDIPQLTNDRNLPIEKKGKIFKLLTKQLEPDQQIIIDNDSHSLNNHLNALSSIVNEHTT